jgi:D-glycerate 3-kinase
MSSVCWPTRTISKLLPKGTPASEKLLYAISQYLQQENVHEAMSQHIEAIYLPMASWLANKHKHSQPLVIGINGAQGSGKSTLAGLLQIIFEQGYGLKVARLSIDDLYLGKRARKMLAAKTHPLLITRGVPGTHDIDKGLALFEKLTSQHQRNVSIPKFDKAIDDYSPPAQWETVTTPIDIILFEGWCVGAKPQSIAQLQDPVNELEAEEDPDCLWRTYVNKQLAGNYQILFKQIDVLMMLKVPSMKQVTQWRGLQERQLKAAIKSGAVTSMEQATLRRFIMHYERLTRHQLHEVPERADAILSLDQNHQIAKIKLKSTY